MHRGKIECDSNLAVPQVDVEIDELAVLLDQVTDLVLLKKLLCLFLHVQTAIKEHVCFMPDLSDSLKLFSSPHLAL